MTTIINKLPIATPSMVSLKTFIGNMSKLLILPFIGITLFLMFWTVAAQNINTSLGKFPGPQAVYEQFHSLYDEHTAERAKAEKSSSRSRSSKRQTQSATSKAIVKVLTSATVIRGVFGILGKLLK